MVALFTSSGVIVFEHHEQVEAAYADLPPEREEDLGALQLRLARLTEFNDEYPLWLGARQARVEECRLELQVELLETRQALAREYEKQALETNLMAAEEARLNARHKVRVGDMEGALVDLRHSLEVADADWPERDRVLRDVDAIEEWLEERR